jgi:hypothetical protein
VCVAECGLQSCLCALVAGVSQHTHTPAHLPRRTISVSRGELGIGNRADQLGSELSYPDQGCWQCTFGQVHMILLLLLFAHCILVRQQMTAPLRQHLEPAQCKGRLPRLLLIALLAAAGGATAAAAICVPNPPDLIWAEGNRGYLEFVPHTLKLQSGTIRTRAWKDALSARDVLLPPPILRLKRGESYSVVVRNGLPEGPTSGAHNTLKDPNIFNLHTHGLHISGEMPADDVWRRVGYQECAE